MSNPKIVVMGSTSINMVNYYTWREAIEDGAVTYMPRVVSKNIYLYIWKVVREVLLNRYIKRIIPPLSSLQYAIEDSIIPRLCTKRIPPNTDIVILSEVALLKVRKRLSDLRKSGGVVVLFLYDPVSFFSESIQQIIKNYCSAGIIDRVYSFDKMDCQSYGFTYWEQVCSPPPLSSSGVRITHDLYFAGRDKGRFEDIRSTIQRVTAEGLKCFVRLPNLTPEKSAALGDILGDGLHEEMLSYDRSIDEMLHSRAILDIVQESQSGVSWRVVEALYYNKKVVTNNKSILTNRYYDPRYIHYFEHPEDIDIEWIGRDVTVDFKYQDDYSPLEFLERVKRDMR